MTPYLYIDSIYALESIALLIFSSPASYCRFYRLVRSLNRNKTRDNINEGNIVLPHCVLESLITASTCSGWTCTFTSLHEPRPNFSSLFSLVCLTPVGPLRRVIDSLLRPRFLPCFSAHCTNATIKAVVLSFRVIYDQCFQFSWFSHFLLAHPVRADRQLM